MVVKMRALKRFRFPEYGPMRNAGDVFEVPGTMRPGSAPAVLKAIGRAEEYREPVAPPAYLTRSMTAAPVAAPVAHTYQTRAAEVAAPSDAERAEEEQRIKAMVRKEQIEGNRLSEQLAAVYEPTEADLDAMDKESLHALAVKLGVKVHHLAGASKVREAIRKAKQ